MSKQNYFNVLLLALLTTACNNQPGAASPQSPHASLPTNINNSHSTAAPRSPTVRSELSVVPKAPLTAPIRKPAEAFSLAVTNLTDNQELTAGETLLFKITSSPGIKTVQIAANGKALGTAKQGEAGKHSFETTLAAAGDFDLEFSGFGSDEGKPLANVTIRVRVIEKTAAPLPPTNGRYMNAYVLKAVKYLLDNHGGLGYNRDKAFTHNIPFQKLGTIRPTGNGQTMCVAAMLEVMVTTLNIYAQETGDQSPYTFLPFESWSQLKPGTFKASVWVNPKLKSAGSADAFAQFGMGERVKFRDLEPGGFINLNRTTRRGHAVVFISFIDKKGKELPRYSEDVAGFKYFSAQGRALKGQGGLGYRYAFFTKVGCPSVPVHRDCNVIYSDNPNMLNVGQLFMPSQWKRAQPFTDLIGKTAAELGEAPIESSLEFDGLTTDD